MVNYILHPVFLFILGSIIGLFPHFFGSDYFNFYRGFYFNQDVLYVYLSGIISFILGCSFFKAIYWRGDKNKKIIQKDLSKVIIFIIPISILIFFKILSIYGTIPIFEVLSGDENISFINEAQKNSGGGIFGLFSLFIFVLIITLPNSYINSNINLYKKFLFFFHLTLVFIFSTYSGKRQMMFILFTYFFSYMCIYYTVVNDKKSLFKIRKAAVFFGIAVVFLFLVIGIYRSNGEVTNIFDPILHYASLPYINLTSIVSHQDLNQSAFSVAAFNNSVLSSVPTFFRGMILDNDYISKIPLLESTSPSTIYGLLFWGFSYLGVVLFSICIGFWSMMIYEKAFYGKNKIYIGIYSLTIWPLLSIHTYNLFLDFTFYIFPVMMIIVGNIIYSFLLPKGDKVV
ncbi:TPA: O-antigen polymerase [Photobacterium damselae]